MSKRYLSLSNDCRNKYDFIQYSEFILRVHTLNLLRISLCVVSSIYTKVVGPLAKSPSKKIASHGKMSDHANDTDPNISNWANFNFGCDL